MAESQAIVSSSEIKRRCKKTTIPICSRYVSSVYLFYFPTHLMIVSNIGWSGWRGGGSKAGLRTDRQRRRRISLRFRLLCREFIGLFFTGFAETVHAADVRGPEQPFVRRQLSVGYHWWRGLGRIRHGSPDRPPSRRYCRSHARGPEASTRRRQHKHDEQGEYNPGSVQ